jgi:carboxylate-amine ligase
MFHLFEKYGIELEYMIVDRDTLRVLPSSDFVMEKACGKITDELPRGEISWSNELVLHVIEYKTAYPVSSFENLGAHFLKSISDTNQILEEINGCLLPGPMHPFMDPFTEMHLWPHACNAVYEAFDRIFSCKGHGWANLQSMHINLSCAGDEEFGRLHAAIRMVLPIIPALSAGSPVVDGKVSGFSDTRMEVYRHNSEKIRSITGDLIPEPVFSEEEYQDVILKPVYRDLAQYDPEGILQEEWVNARGAIARFDRNTIEIRVIDAQETPFADLAIASAVTGVVKLLVDEELCSFQEQKEWATDPLKKIFLDTIRGGENSIIDNSDYLESMGIPEKTATAGSVWKHLVKKLFLHQSGSISTYYPFLETILTEGTLSTRILRAAAGNTGRENIKRVYRALSECLKNGKMFSDKPDLK